MTARCSGVYSGASSSSPPIFSRDRVPFPTLRTSMSDTMYVCRTLVTDSTLNRLTSSPPRNATPCTTAPYVGATHSRSLPPPHPAPAQLKSARPSSPPIFAPQIAAILRLFSNNFAYFFTAPFLSSFPSLRRPLAPLPAPPLSSLVPRAEGARRVFRCLTPRLLLDVPSPSTTHTPKVPMNTAKPKNLEKRRPRTDLVWPSLLLSILVFSGCQSSPSRTSNDGLQPGETIWVCDAQHDVKTEQIEARILADGTVTLPYIGAIRLAGLTISEAERTVEDAYRVSGLYKHLQIRILREQRPTKEGNAGNGHYDAGDKAHR